MITGPFDSLREYINNLEANDRLIRIKQMDQDNYEATGFAYRLVKEYGYDLAPAFLIEKIRINNQWVNGPVIGNRFGGWDAEALIYGVENLGESQQNSRVLKPLSIWKNFIKKIMDGLKFHPSQSINNMRLVKTI